MDEIDSHDGIALKKGISLSDVIANGATFEINFDDLNNFESEEDRAYDGASILNNLNLDCLGLQDEETYNDSEPFEQLAAKMTNLLENGKIKKRIIRNGIGDILPDHATVTYDYNVYIEYSDEPFDSTYIHNRPSRYQLNSGNTIPGLDIALHSMRVNEKAQFLIHPDLAYGKMGCLDRIPPESTVLFEIEVKNCQNTGAAVTFENLTEDEQHKFITVYKLATALCLKGNEHFTKKSYKAAIKEYNNAVSKLLKCVLADYDDQEQQQLLIFRLYVNLVVAYTKIEKPRQACSKCNEIFRMVKGTSLKVPAKVYFNNARALIMLGDFEAAEKKLRTARQMAPNDSTISQEFIKLDKLRKENYDREVALAKVIFKNTEINNETSDKEVVTEELKTVIREYCTELKIKPELSQFSLPVELNSAEIAYIKNEAKISDLLFTESDGKYFITKSPEKTEM